MKAMSDSVQEIKNKLDLVDFLKQYLRLSPAGKNLKAVCPFHKEKTPSFMVSPERQMWHCFGACNEGGDIFKFVMKYENIEFFEALKLLAEKAGVDIKRSGSSDQKRTNVLYEINHSAKEFFKNNFSQTAADYLMSRGLKKETMDEFEVGFASAGRDSLVRHLLNAGYAIADIQQAGLAIKTERGTYWDRFRNRIMFPLYNHFGKVVGFTGRVMPGEIAEVGKYVNSPETPIFNKSKLLYGFHKSKNAIRESRCAVMVEGQMDFLMMWQDGVKNAAAASGTALTQEHLKTLKPVAENLVFIFDSDEAGQAATERAIDLANAYDFTVKVVLLGGEKDPADVVKDHPGAMPGNISSALPVMEYYFQKFPVSSSQFSNLNIGQQKKNLRFLLAKIKNFYSPVERARWLKELENRSGIAERHLLEEMEKLPESALAAGESMKEEASDDRRSRKEIIAERLLTLVSAKQDLSARLQEHQKYLPTMADDPLLSLRVGFIATHDESKLTQEFEDLLRQLKLEHYKERRQEALAAIRLAEQKSDEAALEAALREFDKINKEMQNL